MMRVTWVLGSAFGLLLAGCGGSDDSPATGTPVGCEWFAQDNCWKTAVAEADACVDGMIQGSVSSDDRVCSYTDGTAITFANPLSQESDDNYVWDFSVVRAGQNCVSFKELGATGDGGFLLSTPSGVVKEEVVGLSLVFSCPSGERVQMGAAEAFTCLESLPGMAWAGSGTPGDLSVSFSFLGGAVNEQLFDCRSP